MFSENEKVPGKFRLTEQSSGDFFSIFVSGVSSFRVCGHEEDHRTIAVPDRRLYVGLHYNNVHMNHVCNYGENVPYCVPFE